MMEKVTFAVARTTGKASGFGSFKARLSPKMGRIMRTITTPIKMAFNTEPAIKPAGRRHLKEVFSWKYHTVMARTAFPAITAGNISGMAAMMGEPVKKNAVTGAMILNSNPLHNPTDRTARIMVRLTIGPVIYTDRFLKY